VNSKKLEVKKVTTAMHCNWNTARRRVSRFGLFLVKSVLRMRRKCQFSASDQNSDIATKFSDRTFLKESNNLAMTRSFHMFLLHNRKSISISGLFDLMTLNMCRLLRSALL